ncbi:P-loop containing nucleoside triphosphate hydrolase protein [Zopfochytrium polystomum]|nr:P-loop containing nucleoside triphosphate hydrolase protein [Zopfochytrium polystomum]
MATSEPTDLGRAASDDVAPAEPADVAAPGANSSGDPHLNNGEQGGNIGTIEPISVEARDLSIHVALSTASRFTKRVRSNEATASTATTVSSSVLTILSNVSLAVPPGQLMAIMGGSAASLAKSCSTTSRRKPFIRRRLVAYVQQQDMLLPYLTVRDTLRYAARLRLPRSLSRKEKDAVVESVILELGLKECADTLVGDDWRKGISGGEKRRVSVGVQLLLNPSLIFMDEPTTGLDAFSALSLIETLKQLCCRGRTIIISIHQPRSDIFNACEHVTLLTRGRLAYSGPREGAVDFVKLAGRAELPAEGVNGADFLVDVTSVDDRTPEAERLSRERVDGVVAMWAEQSKAGKDAAGSTQPVSVDKKPADSPVTSIDAGVSRGPPASASFFEQVYILTGRVVANLYEDRISLYGTVTEILIMSIAIGAIFYRLDQSAAGVLGRKSALYSCCALQCYMSLMFTVWKPCGELRVFDRERADKMYSVPAYMIAWFTVNGVVYAILSVLFSVIIYFMIGLRTDDLGHHLGITTLAIMLMQLVTLAYGFLCASINREFGAASTIGNAFYTFLCLSSGFFISLDVIPVYLRWFQTIAYITYGMRLLVSNEFSGNSYDCDGQGCNGDAVVRSLGFQPGEVVGPVGGMIAILAVKVLLAGVLLQLGVGSGAKVAGTVMGSKEERAVIGNGAEDSAVVAVESLLDTPSVSVTIDALSLTFQSAGRRFQRGDAGVSSKPILREISATFRPGQVAAILGASGAGKSTLLQLLHARQPTPPAGVVPVRTGTMLHNGTEISREQVAACTASVRQDDTHLLPALTARETLQYAAQIRLPATMTKKEKLLRAEEVLVELGLKTCADTLVGGGLVKGLSGGEKRRLSVGLAMLTNPSVLLLDEPTSGLDAATARQMMETLRKLAASGKTVVCTIHQPRSDIFPLFDRVLLLARGGRVVYEGPARGLVSHLESSSGMSCPLLTNPADFALDVSSVDLRNQEAEDASRARVARMVEIWTARRGDSIAPQSIVPVVGASPNLTRGDRSPSTGSRTGRKNGPIKASQNRLSFWRVLPLLISRSMLNLCRQPGLVSGWLVQVGFLAVVLTMYFVHLGNNQTSVTSLIGLMLQTSSVVFIGMLNNLAIYPQELLLFRFEHQDNAYSTDAFFWTCLIVALPFELISSLLFAILYVYAIGTRASPVTILFTIFFYLHSGESLGLAFCTFIAQPGFSVQIVSAIIMVLTAMQGFLAVRMPAIITAINYLSPMRYGARAVAIETLSGLQLTCDPGEVCQYRAGEDVLALLEFPAGNRELWTQVGILLVCVVAYRAVAFAVMKWKLGA